MSKIQQDQLLEAIREAVELAVSGLGIDAVRAMSMFPSSRKLEDELQLAA
jgi:hypothetical protein